MKWRGRQGSRNIEDRRRSGGKTAGGIGGVGLIAVLVIGYFLGIDVSPLLNSTNPGSSGQSTQITQADEQAAEFVSVTLKDTETIWVEIFQQQIGRNYNPATLVLFKGATSSPCGGANGASGPFYCPADKKAYLDTEFFTTLSRRLGASGDFAAAYVVAHEIAHHVQNELGTLGEANRARQRMNQADSNRVSVMIELQADCYSGIWARYAQDRLGTLEAGDLKQSDVRIEKFPSAIDAAAAFKADPSIDAAVVWSPDDEDCVRAVPGAKILENTKSASNIIADVFLAKKNYIDDNKDKLSKLYEGWMKGAAEINSSDDAKRKAAKILAENFNGFDEATTYQAIQNVRLCTHGDNMNFFGLDRNYQGVTGEKLYSKMSNEYAKLGYMDNRPPSWRLISRSDVVQSANLVGSEHDAEAGKTFVKVTTEEGKKKEAIATKRLKIGFASGSYQLDGNAKTLIDLTFVDIAKAFSNAQIRIEGNTDNVGSRATNIALSQKRAQSVADYLIKVHGMPVERFIIIGNGPSKPVAGCEGNNSSACKSKNRRTEFELVK